jgi:hypothetical protein
MVGFVSDLEGVYQSFNVKQVVYQTIVFVEIKPVPHQPSDDFGVGMFGTQAPVHVDLSVSTLIVQTGFNQ